MNIENLLINRVVRGTLFNRLTNEVIFSLDEISNPTLECGGEQVYATDALGQNIAAFDRSKTASFSGENAMFNFGLMAAQFGTDKEIASSDNKIAVPKFELIVVQDTSKVTLKDEPVDTSVKYIYSTNPDKSKNTAFKRGTAASTTEFALTGKEISLPTGAFEVGDKVAIWYDAEVEKDAQIIRNTTKDFAKSGKFVLEVLVAEPCAPEVEYYAYIIFNSAKLDNNVSLNLTTEANHPFSITALRDYCSDYDELFSLIVAA